jgi:GH43 family beta-xylosidase
MSEPDCEKQEPCGYPQLDCVLGVYITKCEDRIEALEAKLAKAVEGLRDAVDAWDNHNKTGDMMQGYWVTNARATLAEIEGEKG